MDELAQEDWDELESGTPAPLDVDWDRVTMLERQGIGRILSARRDGRLIGYNAFFVLPRIHSRQWLQAVNSMVYVAPSERGRAGVALVRCAERDLFADGVREIIYAVKPFSARTRALFERMGYVHSEDAMAKRRA